MSALAPKRRFGLKLSPNWLHLKRRNLIWPDLNVTDRRFSSRFSVFSEGFSPLQTFPMGSFHHGHESKGFGKHSLRSIKKRSYLQNRSKKKKKHSESEAEVANLRRAPPPTSVLHLILFQIKRTEKEKKLLLDPVIAKSF